MDLTFGYTVVGRRIWSQEFYQDDSHRLRTSFENDRWQNIKREYRTFRRPHGANSEPTDALAAAMPPSRSTLEMLLNIVSGNPIPDGTQRTCISAGSGQLRLFVAMLRGSSDSAKFQPCKIARQH
jgi:hypothetical protein